MKLRTILGPARALRAIFVRMVALGLALVGASAQAQDFLRTNETTFAQEAHAPIAHTVRSLTQSDGTVLTEIRFAASTNVPALYPTLSKVVDAHRAQISARLRADGLARATELLRLDPATGDLVYSRAVPHESQATVVEREAIGLIAAAQTYGVFDHDQIMSAKSGLAASEIKKLREAAFTARILKKPLLVSFIFADYEREARDLATTPRASVRKGDSWSVQIAPNIEGHAPLTLGNDAIVWHRFAHQAKSLIGGTNPALANAKIALMLENKWVEYLFWETYAPGVMAKTEILSDLFSSRPSASDTQKKLNERFPGGWVMKGAFDWATGPMVLTSATDLPAAIEKYRLGDFAQHLAKLDAEKHKMDPDDYVEALQKHPDYKGYRAQRLLKRYERAIVQTKLEIRSEYRVEVANGRVVGGDSTVERYAYLAENPKTFWDPQPAPRALSEEQLKIHRDVEAFAQSIMDRLPKDLHPLSAAMDVALTKDGRLYLIEANAGGNSGYLSFRAGSRRALERRLLENSAAGTSPADQRGLGEAAQVAFVGKFLKDHHLDVAHQYPDFAWTSEGLKGRWLEKPHANSCNALFSKK